MAAIWHWIITYYGVCGSTELGFEPGPPSTEHHTTPKIGGLRRKVTATLLADV